MGEPLQMTERRRMCDLMVELGPTEPTLCEGWTTYDMAAHLYVREHDPVAGIGIVIPPAERLHDAAIERTKERTPFDALVAKVRSGPPLWWKPIDGLANLQEMFVHHEDVRRGGGDLTPRPVSEIGAVEARLWGNLHRAHVLLTRGIRDVRVELQATGEAPITAGRGDGTATITGRAGEIVLYLLGRRAAADVEITGSADARAALERAHLGL